MTKRSGASTTSILGIHEISFLSFVVLSFTFILYTKRMDMGFIERLQKEMEVKERETNRRKIRERSKKKEKRARYKQNRKEAKRGLKNASQTNSAEQSTRLPHVCCTKLNFSCRYRQSLGILLNQCQRKGESACWGGIRHH